jgi:hypothetical protein
MAEQVRVQSQERQGTLGNFQALARQDDVLLRIERVGELRPTTWAFEQS